MDFDPLAFFTPVHSNDDENLKNSDSKNSSSSSNSLDIKNSNSVLNLDIKNSNSSNSSSLLDSLEIKNSNSKNSNSCLDEPLHFHDLPLLQLNPPHEVLESFLKLLAPNQVHNFDAQSSKNLSEKNINDEEITAAANWLASTNLRFPNKESLLATPSLAEALRLTFPSQYNRWLTHIIANPLDWLDIDHRDSIHALASVRLAENCGRTAQPEFIRHIDIPALGREILLKEPSITADNLGLKTWGSSYILANRLANNHNLCLGHVLELGSGTGLVGMAASILGFPTFLTDLPEIVPNLRENVHLNNIQNVSVAELDWSCPDPFDRSHPGVHFDTVILSDPVYLAKHPPWIVAMITKFLAKSKHSRVLIQVPLRKGFHQERTILWSLMQENHLVVDEEATEHGRDDFGECEFLFRRYRWAS